MDESKTDVLVVETSVRGDLFQDGDVSRTAIPDDARNRPASAVDDPLHLVKRHEQVVEPATDIGAEPDADTALS